MKIERIIDTLKQKLDDSREYEFWFNDHTGCFGGNCFFDSMERQMKFETECKYLYELRECGMK